MTLNEAALNEAKEKLDTYVGLVSAIKTPYADSVVLQYTSKTGVRLFGLLLDTRGGTWEVESVIQQMGPTPFRKALK